MKEISERLLNLSEQISDAKQQVAVLQGRKEEATKRLKEEFLLDSIESAQEYIEKSEKEILILEKSIQEDFKKLQEDFKW
jgi:chromosome segregation ATPase